MGYMGIQFSDTPIFQKQLIIRCVLYHFKMYVLICILYVYTYIYIYYILFSSAFHSVDPRIPPPRVLPCDFIIV